MAYTIKESVHIDIRVNGEDLSADIAAGDVELHPAIAEVLVANGIATQAAAKKVAKSTPTDESVEA